MCILKMEYLNFLKLKNIKLIIKNQNIKKSLNKM